MTLANYGIGSSRHKDPNSAKALSKSLQIRNRAEMSLKQCLKSHYRLTGDKRNEILNSIKDYYSRVPFNVIIWNKYQTKQCIVDSILLLDSKFNPYKAKEAFKTVEKMLVNLVYLPWHREFRKIYTYSGQFRLIVSEPLIGIEEVFKAAGFKPESNFYMHLVLPDDKMPQTDDGESVTSVIFDCMIAQVVFANIIEVFENCCKASRMPGDHLLSEVNCYSWIQAYFRERSHQTTQHACSNIQELLNNITNHLSRLEFSVIKSSPKNEHHPSLTIGQPSDRSEIANFKMVSSDNRQSPILSAQERTQKFLAQQSIEDEDLLKLSDDLLRLPTEANIRVAQTNKQHYTDYDGSGQKLATRPPTMDSIQRASLRDNGYIPQNQHHQESAIFNRFITKSIDPYDTFDNQGNNLSMHRCMEFDSLNHPIGADIPHNDREPLIPRQDQKFNAHQGQALFKRSNLYENEFSCINHIGQLTQPNSASHLGAPNRHQFDKHYLDGSSSHHQQQASNHLIRSPASKYGNSSNKKYELRDMDKAINNRLHWSCSSCTYNNQISSEICEICRSRRSSR